MAATKEAEVAETTEDKTEPDKDSQETEADKVDHSDRPNWESEARKHERRAKQTAKRVAELESQLKEREDADKSEHEKALEQARKEAADAAKAEALSEVKAERLSAAIARLAAGRFAKVEHAERLLDVDSDDIFDDEGKVQTEALKSALDTLLEENPNLAATPSKPSGDADGGKGKASTPLSEMGPEAHFQQIRRHK